MLIPFEKALLKAHPFRPLGSENELAHRDVANVIDGAYVLCPPGPEDKNALSHLERWEEAVGLADAWRQQHQKDIESYQAAMELLGFHNEHRLYTGEEVWRFPDRPQLMDFATAALERLEMGDIQGLTDVVRYARLFRRLKTPPKPRVDSPKVHMLKQLENMLGGLEYVDTKHQSLLKHFSFWHDVGKVVSPTHAAHGYGSAQIARDYYEHQNAAARLHRKAEPHSPEFINEVCWLVEHHHFFAQMHHFVRKDLRKKLEKQTVSNDNNRWEAVYKGESDVFDIAAVKMAYPEIFAKPHLLDLLYQFTVADIATNDDYQRWFGEINDLFYQQLQQAVEKLVSARRGLSQRKMH